DLHSAPPHEGLTLFPAAALCRSRERIAPMIGCNPLLDYALLYMLRMHGKRKELLKTIKRLAGKTNDAERKAILRKLETVVRRNA
ncbi:MAG: hypothetical protein QXS12_05820, partial [Candidatus Caldarchaeum sp.]